MYDFVVYVIKCSYLFIYFYFNTLEHISDVSKKEFLPINSKIGICTCAK